MPSPQTAKQPTHYPAANTKAHIEISAADLPLYCPEPGSALWASHPRVYLPIHEASDGQIRCPYCGTVYVLR
ncbi:zinc-finger domain-containing protein [Thiorhodospira sibirica]|uniref:zinc-finger domain-containing protein n=1 Tax=Thiorhodospira sibirica TaxID=154347 RepID=UPI00022C1112|nr:zinc-finger domain-containing protein [Thiorhodospira sibirica]